MEDTAAAEPLVSSVAPCSPVRDVIDVLVTVHRQPSQTEANIMSISSSGHPFVRPSQGPDSRGDASTCKGRGRNATGLSGDRIRYPARQNITKGGGSCIPELKLQKETQSTVYSTHVPCKVWQRPVIIIIIFFVVCASVTVAVVKGSNDIPSRK